MKKMLIGFIVGVAFTCLCGFGYYDANDVRTSTYSNDTRTAVDMSYCRINVF